MATKAKNMRQRRTFLEREGGSGVRDMVPPSLGNVGTKFSQTSILHFKTLYNYESGFP